MNDATQMAVELRTYEIWQEAGWPDRHGLTHWLQAELELGVITVEPSDPFVLLHELATATAPANS